MLKINNYLSFIFLMLTIGLVILIRTRFIFEWHSFKYIFYWVPNLAIAFILSLIGFGSAFLVKKPYIRWIALIGNMGVLFFIVGYTILMVILLNYNPNPK